MKKSKKEEIEDTTKEKTNSILIGILILLIIILLGVILYIEKDKIMDLFNHKENEVIRDENGNIIETVYSSLTKEDTTKYKNTETFYKQDNEFCVYDDDCTSQDKVEIKVENKDIDILDYYKGKYLFYRDNNKIKVYNDETKLSYVINISSKFYSYVFGVDYVTDEFIGIVYHESEKDNPSYFSVTENKVLYNRKYEYLELLSKKYLTAGREKTIDEDEEYPETVTTDAYLLSATNEKVIMSYKNEPNEEDYYTGINYGVLENKNGEYLYLAEYEADEIIKEIYTSSLKTIIRTDDYIEASIADSGELYILNNNVVDVYNNDGKKVKTSKEYKDLLQVCGEYIIAIENNKLIVTTIDEKTTEITNWNKNKYYHTGLSGWYTENGKNGIYMVVEENITADEVFKYCTKHDSCDGMTLQDLKETDRGYEYYYIPETGETGRIPTYIGGYAKPILYLYPIKDTNVKVTFDKPENLTTTYPKYINSWDVLAKTNGDLYDQNGRYYYGLYWEEKLNHKVDFSEGFYVNGKNAIDFLESKLSIIGLTERESNEFIMYWLPILEKNEHNLVYFELTKERDSYSKINISPKPDSMLRMAIHVKKVDGYTPIREEKLEPFKRNGFTVVEWGGVMY